MNLKILLFTVIISCISTKRFCHYSSKEIINNQQQYNEFQSYHPQYLHSYSYPQPSSFHMYFGRVQYNLPTFLIQNGFQSHQKQMLIVNDKSKHLTSSHKQSKYSTKFMLIIAIQDSDDDDYVQQSILSIRKQKYIYSINMKNSSESKNYIMYFTQKGQTSTNAKVTIRDVSKTPKTNWRISRQIKWNVAQQINIINSTAIAIQIDTGILKDIHIHFKEVKVFDSRKQDHEQMVNLYDRIYYYNKENTNIKQTCASSAYNRLIQGLSYEYGNLQVVNGTQSVPNQYKQLLSFSPSRKRFPWGFLWDDGFHNQIAIRKDKQLSFKVIKSWFSTNINGWIPREQNRGKQRQQLCNCAPYMKKDIRDGNPPTLILPIQYMIKNKLFLASKVKQIWSDLKSWYQWYLRTQMVDDSYHFKWFDHIPAQGSFNSGLDDFPRPSSTKYHVDAQSWMFHMARTMQLVSEYINQSSQKYKSDASKILKNIHKFIQPQTSTLRDVADGFVQTTFSTEVGYPSLLPLAFGMLEVDSKQFNATINLITNKKQLNTSFGLSSISQSSKRYLQSQNAYWRGPVWININYLVVRGLKLFYPSKTQVYNNLRKDLLQTVCGEYNKSGYFFENYLNGSGNRIFSYPFNGWTSLIYIISKENY